MRIDTVDIIKAISIIMIVNVHLISGQFFIIGCTYHVIAFFFTAGIIHSFSEKWRNLSVYEFIKDKAYRLAYPYFTLSLCYVCFHLLLNAVRGNLIFNEVISESLLKTVTLQGIGTLWFLPILFFGEVLFFLAKRKKILNRFIIIIAILSVFVSSFLNSKEIVGNQWIEHFSLYAIMVNTPVTLLLSSLIAMGFIDLGYILYKMKPNIFICSNPKNKKYLLYLIILCAVSFAFDFTFIKFYRGDLHKLDIGNPIIYIVCSLSGLSFVSTLALIIEKYFTAFSSILLYYGRNSLIIMTTHTEYYINSIVYIVFVTFLSLLNISVDAKLLSGISLAVIMIIETGIIYIINHSLLKYIYTIKKRS